ncbi:N2,N2-dimethylguanosine tRNA methyltransferase isoform X2 [Wolffia australiana]
MAILPQTIYINPSKSSPSTRRTQSNPISSSLETERGVEFETGGSFFRRESSIGRDLGVLSAVLHGRALGSSVSVLDAMCGCGVRSLRYLKQAQAGFVWANDADEQHRKTILSNLSRAENGREIEEKKRWVVSHADANRVLAESYLHRRFFDLIDIDSFGSNSGFMRAAVAAVKVGGLLYLTSTDGYTSGGHRPQQMLIGGALREASALGFHLKPLFSYYSYHGPVFRVMLRLLRGKLHNPCDYRFIGYCNKCGHSQAFSWEKIGNISCPCRPGEINRSIVVSGPLWTGPLHDGNYLGEMLELASEFGWTDLEGLLTRMMQESDPRLPFGYIKLDEIACRGKIDTPPLGLLIARLQKEGYAASRSHIKSAVLKTDCPISTCIEIAKKLQCS